MSPSNKISIERGLYGFFGIGLLISILLVFSSPKLFSSADANIVPSEFAGMQETQFFNKHPYYPDANFIPLGHFETNGSPLEIALQSTTASPDEVVAFYEKSFSRQTKHFDRRSESGQHTLSYYDDALGATFVLNVIQPPTSDSTMILSSVYYSSANIQFPAENPPHLPAFDTAVTLLNVSDPYNQRAPNQTYTQVIQKKARETLEFYTAALQKQGWSVQMTENQNGIHSVVYMRGDERLQLSATETRATPPETHLLIIVDQPEEAY